MQRTQASLLPAPHPWGGGAWPHAEPHLPTPTPQVHCGALFSPGSWEALSTGMELHTQTSIGCSSAPSASAKDGGLDRVSPAPPSRRPLPGAQQSRDPSQDSGTQGPSQLWAKRGQRGCGLADLASQQVPGEGGRTRAGRHRGPDKGSSPEVPSFPPSPHIQALTLLVPWQQRLRWGYAHRLQHEGSSGVGGARVHPKILPAGQDLPLTAVLAETQPLQRPFPSSPLPLSDSPQPG